MDVARPIFREDQPPLQLSDRLRRQPAAVRTRVAVANKASPSRLSAAWPSARADFVAMARQPYVRRRHADRLHCDAALSQD